MKTATHLIRSAVLLTGAFFVSSTLACTTSAWSSAEAGTMADDPTNGVPRVSGLCGLEVTGTGHVVDNSPADETTFIGRFYVFPKLLTTGVHEVFVAVSDQAIPDSDVFTITYDADAKTFIFNATAGGSDTVAADATHWNLIEINWVSGGNADIWVNADATSANATSTFAAGPGSVDQVRLGATGAVPGVDAEIAYFDDYESHRSLPVGALLMGDSNGNDSINLFDLISIQNDILGNGLANGQPDCNLNGAVNLFDLICTQNIILGN